MIIDDSSTIRRTAEALLNKAGYDVYTAGDGFEAMSLITDNEPDIIFNQFDSYHSRDIIGKN